MNFDIQSILLNYLYSKQNPNTWLAAEIIKCLIDLGCRVNELLNLEKNHIPQAMQLADLLRKELGVAVYIDSLRRSIKSQMRHANKINAKFSIIFDSESLKENKILIKNMNENKQESVLIDNIISYFESE